MDRTGGRQLFQHQDRWILHAAFEATDIGAINIGLGTESVLTETGSGAPLPKVPGNEVGRGR